MEKLPELTSYFAHYGYLALFLFVFLQQIGIPNPITNEFVLIFCGYLSYSGTLNIYEAILVAIVADFIGTLILFFVFFFFSKWLIEHSPKWLPITGEGIEKFKGRVMKHGQRSIFIGRMTPFIRGYTAVAAGMLNVNRKAFMGTALISAVIWNAGLVLIGQLVGPYWSIMIAKSGLIGNVFILIVFVAIIIVTSKYFKRRQEERKAE